jgi:hypothetical protein
MAHSYKYFGLSLGQILSEHSGDLATQLETGSWCSFDPRKSIRVKLKSPGMTGFLHPHKSVTSFGGELFDSKSEAEEDALAKLYHNTQHKGQLSTLPAERRDAVKARYDEIQKWTENAKPKKKGTGGREGSGKGYKVVKKRGGGTHLLMQFEPPDAYKSKFKHNGPWTTWHLPDTEANRALVEEAHSANPHIQRRKHLESAPEPDARRKFGDDRTNSSSESSPEASRPAAKKKLATTAPEVPQLGATATRRGRAPARPASTTGGRRRGSTPRPRAPRRGALNIVFPADVAGNPYAMTDEDKKMYRDDVVAWLQERHCKPHAAVSATYQRTFEQFCRKCYALGYEDPPPDVMMPCLPPMLPGLHRASARDFRTAFLYAWRTTDGGDKASLEVALNDYVFEQTRMGRNLAEVLLGRKFPDGDWPHIRRLYCVSLLFGAVQTGPEAIVFWRQAASESQCHGLYISLACRSGSLIDLRTGRACTRPSTTTRATRSPGSA